MVQVILLVFIGIASAAGYWFGKNEASGSKAKTPKTEKDWDISNAYSERFQNIRLWQEILKQFHKQLFNLYTVTDMSNALIQCIKEVYPAMSVVGGIGSLQDFIMLDTFKMMNIAHLEMGSKAFTLSLPTLDEGVRRELINELYKVVIERGNAHKTCFLLKDVNPQLQLKLERNHHFSKQSIVAPIYCGDILCGIFLYSSNEIHNNPDLLHDIYNFMLLINETIATWLKAMAPHILSGNAAHPTSAAPIQAISTLNILEQTLTSVQQDGEQQQLLDKLADYSQAIVTPSPELSLLATQTCSTLRNICQEDFTMFLLPIDDDHPNSFRAEAFETVQWVWSRNMGYMKEESPPLLSQYTLDNVSDPFVDKIIRNGQLIEMKFAKDVQTLAPSLDKIQLQSLVAIPSLVRGKCNAILVVGRKTPGGLPDLVKSISISVTALSGISLASLYLSGEVNKLKENLNTSWGIFTKTNEQYIETLKMVVKKHGLLIMTRADEVSYYSMLLAQQMHLDSKKVGLIKIAAMFCDIGTILLPPSILRKEGGLTKEEWHLIQSHPKLSVEILQNLDIMKEAILTILHHHEHFDGNGYPDGLRGENIPIEARIIRVADAYVNLQINRPYRAAFSQAEAMNLIVQDSGKQFDPAVVRALLQVITNIKEEVQAA